jgi:hypothetical protein
MQKQRPQKKRRRSNIPGTSKAPSFNRVEAFLFVEKTIHGDIRFNAKFPARMEACCKNKLLPESNAWNIVISAE